MRPKFTETLKGKDTADAEVVRSLYQRIKGYEVNGQHIAAHPTAIIFWLKNRQREKWRDRHELEHGGGVTVSEADPMKVGDALVTLANTHPMMNPMIRSLALDLLACIPETPGSDGRLNRR